MLYLFCFLQREHPQINLFESEHGSEARYRAISDLAFVLAEFDGADFSYLKAENLKIFGPTALREYLAAGEVNGMEVQ